MQICTSAMSPLPAALTAWIRFSAASLDGRSLERWEPTITIGTGVFCTMKRQHRGGVAHRVGAMADHDAVGARLDLLADCLGQRQVLLLGHVLAEHAEELLGGQVGDVRQLRHRAIKLSRA